MAFSYLFMQQFELFFFYPNALNSLLAQCSPQRNSVGDMPCYYRITGRVSIVKTHVSKTLRLGIWRILSKHTFNGVFKFISIDAHLIAMDIKVNPKFFSPKVI